MLNKKYLSFISLVIVSTFNSVKATANCKFDISISTPAWSNCESNKYYLWKKDCYNVGCEIKKSVYKGSYLYKCTGPTACTQVTKPGYYINDENEMFTCKISSNEFNCKKTAIPVPDGSYSFTASDVGKIFIKNTSEKHICITSGEYASATVQLSATTHLLTLPADNVYGVESGKKAIVQVASDAPISVTLADVLPECTFDDSPDTDVCKLTVAGTPSISASKYCITNAGAIYSTTGTSDACVAEVLTTSPTFLFKKDSDGLYHSKNDFGTAATNSGLIYTCNQSTCGQLKSHYYLYDNGLTAASKVLILYKSDENDVFSPVTPSAGFYLAGAGTTTNGVTSYDKLIYCSGTTASTCSDYQPIKPGYYINAGSESSTKPIIRCSSGTSCTAIGLSTSECNSQIIGGLIKTSDSKIKLCVNENEAVDINTTSPIYKTITTTHNGDFPGVNTGTINIKITKIGEIYKLEDDDSGLSTTDCTQSTCDSNTFYYLSSKICKGSGSSTCTDINGDDYGVVEAGNRYIYFTSETEVADISNSNAEVNMVYECTFGSSEYFPVSSCTQIKHGIIYDSVKQKVVSCNGWEGEGCRVESSSGSCAASDEGRIVVSGANKSICFGSKSIALPTSEASYIAFLPKQANSIFGIGNSEVFLKLTSNSAIVTANNDACITVGYHLNVNVSGSNRNALIYCGTANNLSSCRAESTFNGYYLKSDKETKEVFVCSTTGCTTTKIEATSCGKSGSLVYASGIKLCKEDSDGSPSVIPDGGSIVYHTITVEANKFPGVTTASTINVKIEKDFDRAVLMEDASLPECPTTIPTTGVCVTGATEGEHCIHKSTKKIYRTTGGKCVAIVSTTPAKTLYFNNSNRIISTIENGMTSLYMAYQCTFTYNDSIYVVNSCYIVKGYLVTSGLIVNCNGWKGEQCVVSSRSGSGACAGGNEGVLPIHETAKKICFGDSTEIDLSTLTKDKLVAFDATVPNAIYGMSKGVIFLKLTSTSALVTSVSDEENKYYFNQLAPGSPIRYDKTNRLWKSDDFVKLATDKVYAYIDACDPTSKTVINSVGGSAFVSTDISDSLATSNKYYVLDGANSKKIIKCTNEDGCSIIDSTANTYYTDPATPANIIKCTSEACTSIAHEGSGSPVFFIDAGVRGNILSCVTGGCTSIPGSAASGHAYIDKSDATNKSVIICSGGVCTSSVKTTSSATLTNYFIDGSNPSQFISCSNTSCTTGTTAGLYVDAIDTTKIITCSANGCFSTKTITPCSSTVSGCKYKNGNQDTALNTNNYCVNSSDQKIYKAESSTSCASVNPSTATTTMVFLKSSDNFYVKAEFGKDNKGYIYECDNTSCKQLISTNYLYVDDPAHPTVKYLYECDEVGFCNMINQSNEGYYLSGVSAYDASNNILNPKLIKCKDQFIINCELVSPTPAVGYYIDGSNSKNIIECKTTTACYSIPGSTDPAVAYIDISKKDNYINDLGSTVNDLTKHLITCQSGICKSEDKCTEITSNNDKKFYFIDGSDFTKVITCSYDSEVNHIASCISSKGYLERTNKYYLDGIESKYTIKCETDNTTPCSVEKGCRVETGENCNDKTYYVINGDSKTAKTYLYEYDPSSIAGYLYYCSKNNDDKIECSLIEDIGIYVNVNDNTVYECTGSPVKCKTVGLGTCSLDGKLFINDNYELSLCLASSSTFTPLSIISKDVLLSDIKDVANAFQDTTAADNTYALVKVDDHSVTLNKNYIYTKNYYIYTQYGGFEVLEESKCPANEQTSLDEFDCDPAYYCTKVTPV